MNRPPSDATSLRKTRELLNTYKIRVTKLEQEIAQRDIYKMRAAKAEQELAQWKIRFDALLMRAPQISDPTTTEKNT